MRIILAMVVVLAALGAAPAWAAAPVEAGKVFTGPSGEEVALVALLPREGGRFLVRLQGTGTEFDGMVLPHELNDWTGTGSVRQDYSTERRGRGFTTLTIRDSRHELYVPGRRSGIPVKYDEARTQALNAEALYARHQAQQKDGTLAKLMAFDGEAERASHERAYAEQLQALSASCGAAVAGAIDWSTISEELLKGYSISSYCETPLTSLKALCDVSDEAKRTVQAKVTRIDCRFGASLEPRLESSRVVWTTSKDAANQDEAATRFFKKSL